MKINAVENFYKSPILKNGLKFAQDNSALFVAGTTLLLSTIARPISIALTPKTDKEDKKAAIAKSIGSSVTGFLFMLLFSMPLAKGVKKIDNNPEKYLNLNTLEKLKGDSINIQDSKAYQLATQFFKLGLGFLLAYPKAIVQNKIIPKITENKEDKKEEKPSFKGCEKFIAKTINNPSVFNFADKYKNTNFTTKMICLSDIFSSLAFIHLTNRNKNLDERKKKVLNVNSALSTAMCIIAGVNLDKATQKPFEKFIRNIKKYNSSDKNLSLYVQGAKIAKTSLIFGLIYYCLIPVISTFTSGKIVDKIKNNSLTDNEK